MPTVLVIDDQKETVRLIESILATRKIETISAPKAQEGLALMRQHLPDVVIMDLLLPEIDGFTAIEMMKDDEDLQDIPVIAITAASIAHTHERLREVGADAFIGKPFQIPQLINLVERFIK